MIKPKVTKISLAEDVGPDHLVRQEFMMEHPDKGKDFRAVHVHNGPKALDLDDDKVLMDLWKKAWERAGRKDLE